MRIIPGLRVSREQQAMPIPTFRVSGANDGSSRPRTWQGSMHAREKTVAAVASHSLVTGGWYMITCTYGDCDVYWSVVARKGRVTSASPRNLGEVALEQSERAFACLLLVASVCFGQPASQPASAVLDQKINTRTRTLACLSRAASRRLSISFNRVQGIIIG